MHRTVFYVSDSTGITAETLGRTLLTQFDSVEYTQITLPFITDVNKANDAVTQINRAAERDQQRPIVFSTLTSAEVYEIIARCNALVLDLFSVFIRPLEREFNRGSTHVRGRSHELVDRASYEIRIDAVDFALSHDDGASTRHYGEADIILIGVSRSGKTPTCIYLAMQFGIRAANYPITEESLNDRKLPEVLLPYRERLFGLTIDADRLRQIRSERRPNSRYASVAQCRTEVREVESLFRSHGIKLLDTSSTSIEEIATRLLQETGLKRRLY
ncbi:MAG: kinase/pyrophosphorylase [Gammaproteobacteria bacterium]|nr:kinase/pyrophosphorylase [Gammaproteobacteria bacterium]